MKHLKRWFRICSKKINEKIAGVPSVYDDQENKNQ
jgi:hypothetical protein